MPATELTATMGRRPSARVACFAMGLVLVLYALGGGTTRADEVSGLQVASALEQQVVEAIARCERSVVAIARIRIDDTGTSRTAMLQFGRPTEPQASDPDFIPNEYGTGVVVGARGLILTNYHVLGDFDSSQYYVTTASRQTYRAEIVGADPRSDLAVLQLQGLGSSTELEPIPFGDATKLRKGQFVISLGNPYGIARDGQVSASWGIISNLARKAAPDIHPTDAGERKTALEHFGMLIQTDARLNLGTSGGALLNLNGEMIGLTTSIAAQAAYETAAGFAIPVDDTFRRVVETLKQGKEVEYGFLGVRPENLTLDMRQRGLRGALIAAVVRGTPADAAGLRPDDLVTEINDTPIYDSDGLMLEVGKLPVESDVKLSVRRGTERLDIVARLAKLRVRGKQKVTEPEPDWRGLRVDYITAAHDLTTLVVPALIEGGVAVREVVEGTPAWEAELRETMFVTHVGGRRVSSPREFREAVAQRTGPVDLQLLTESNARLTKTIEPERF